MAYKDKSVAVQYNNDYNRKNYDRIAITPSKERGQEIRAAAARAGQSVNAYVLQAVEERKKREEE